MFALLFVTIASPALLGAGLARSGVVEPVARVDATLATALHDHATGGLTSAMGAVTELGGSSVLVPVTALAALLLWRRGLGRQAALLLGAMVGAQILTSVLKLVVQRERPLFPDPLATARNFSFPSGHAMVSLAVYGALALIVAQQIRSRWARHGVLAAAGLLVLAIGFSRLYLGVHYLSDVVVGYALGLTWLLVCVALSGAGSLPRTAVTARALESARPTKARLAA